MAPRTMAGNTGTLLVALAATAVVLLVAQAALVPPAPRGADAPSTEFSAERAQRMLADLAGDGSPRPTGSPAAGRAAGRAAALLAGAGYSPRVEVGFVCRPGNVCGTVKNVVAELPGATTSTVLAMAHYDSVGAGPGIADDLSGVASLLEVARALKSGPRLRNGVTFLIAEGEEVGSLGAEAFARRSPLAKRVAAVVNVEARGTSGPSLLFETGGGEGRSLDAYAAGARRPVASSVFAWLYGLLPNYTDFTVFARNGLSGLNFAFIGDPALYHTSSDSLSHLSRASLQHQGENALAAVRGLAGTDLSQQGGREVYFDLLGRSLIAWPIGWTLPLAALGLAVLAVIALVAIRRGRIAGADLLAGLGSLLAVTLAASLLSWLFNFALQAFASPLPAFPTAPGRLQASFWLLASGIAILLPISRRTGAGVWLGVAIAWSAFSLAFALVAPEVAYLFLVPALAAALVGPVAVGGTPAWSRIAFLVPGLVAGCLWFPLLLLVGDGFGTELFWMSAIAIAFLLTWLAAISGEATARGRRWIAGTAFALSAVALGAFLIVPRQSAAAPASLNLIFREDADGRKGEWIAQAGFPLPQDLAALARFERRDPAYPWPGIGRTLHAPAAAMGLAGPRLDPISSVTEGSSRRVRARLISLRGASFAALMIPEKAALSSIRIGGEVAPPIPGEGYFKRDGWLIFRIFGVPPEGVEIEMVVKSPQMQCIVLDRTAGLPPLGASLQKARPPWTATSGDGDVTLVSRSVNL